MEGLWVWPSDPKAQRKTIKMLRRQDRLVAVMKALGREKEGLSNAQIDAIVGSNSQWKTLWYLRQLMAAGFVEYQTEFFGDAGKCALTELGRTIFQIIVGQPSPQQITTK